MTLLDRQACSPGYWDSPWPVECGGNRRQKARRGRLDAAGASAEVVVRRSDRWEVMAVRRDPGEWYVGGTMPAFRADGPRPYGWVQRIDPRTLKPLAESPPLPCGEHVWCGAILVHANGSIYSVNGSYLHRLDPFDLSVTVERRLVDCSHNGMLALSDGSLVTKDLRLSGQGCSTVTRLDPETLDTIGSPLVLPEGSMGRIAADFVAVLPCLAETAVNAARSIAADSAGSTGPAGACDPTGGIGQVESCGSNESAGRVDPTGLSSRNGSAGSSAPAPAGDSGAAASAGSAVVRSGRDVIYVPGTEHLFRLALDGDDLVVDPDWQPRYRTADGPQGPAWDVCLSDGWCWLMDNGDIEAVRHIHTTFPNGRFASVPDLSWRQPAPRSGPQRLIRVRLDDPDQVEQVAPFGTPGGGIIAPPVNIPEHRIAIAWDSVNGGLAGIGTSGAPAGAAGRPAGSGNCGDPGTPTASGSCGDSANRAASGSSGASVSRAASGSSGAAVSRTVPHSRAAPDIAAVSGGLEVVWQLPVRATMQPVVFPDSGELVINDFTAAGSDDIVVVDVTSGEIVSRVASGSRIANGMFLSAGDDRDVYYCTTTARARIHWSS